MKRIVTLLLSCLMTVATWAEIHVVVFDPQQDGDVTTQAGPFEIEKDCVTLVFSNGLANGNQYRVYKHQTLTVKVCAGTILNVEFQCTAEGTSQYGPGCFVASVGDYTYEGKIGVWAGSSPMVTFTAATNQVRLTRVIVTYDDGDGVSTPMIRPASGTYYEPFEAIITCYSTNASIHYTTDGSDPDAESPVYTAPIRVDRDMTLKAVSVLDGEMSSVVAAEYHIQSIADVVNCFEDLESLGDETMVRFTSPIYAVAQAKRYLFAKDQCGGYALIFGDVGQTYHSGDVIPAGFIGTKTTYSGEMELKNPANFQPATGNITIEPEKISLDQAGHDLFAHYVIVEDVTIIEEEGTYYAVDSLGNRIPLYFNRFDCPVPADLSRHYDITGIIGSYGRENIIYQLLPIIIKPHDDYYQKIGLGNYWQFYNPETPSSSITFELDATVILQTGSYLYAKDETGYGLIYGNVGQTYKHGDVIPAGYGGMVTYYDGWPEIKQPFSGFQPSKDHVDVIPEEVTIPELRPDISYWAHFVIIKHVIIDEAKGVIRDENGNELPIFIRPGLPFTYPDDLSKPIDVCGIVTVYHGKLQLLVWDLNDKDPEPIHCLRDSYNLENPNAEFRVKLVVIYQNGVNLYAQDLCEDYILMYGNIGGQFVNGDTIEGVARWGIYQNQKQLVPIGDWTLVGHGPAVEPTDAGCTEEVSQDMCHWYLIFENVEIVEEDGKINIEDECGRLLIYNKFGVNPPYKPAIMPHSPYDINHDGEVNIADINCLIDLILSGRMEYDWLIIGPDGGPYDTYDISGFLAFFNGELELYPVKINYHNNSYIIGDTNFDCEVNVADLNTLIDIILSN